MAYKKFSCLLILSCFYIAAIVIPLNADTVDFSVNPGFYNEDQYFQVKNFPSDVTIFYSFVDDFKQDAPLLPFTRTLLLSAVNGEEREYKIRIVIFKDKKKIDEKQLTYVIDKKKPYPPGIDKIPGEYNQNILISFKKGDYRSIFYSINKDVLKESLFWDGNPLNLKAEEKEKKSYMISAFCIDSQGNYSNVVTYNYTINRIKENPVSMRVLNPQPGSYSNKQVLIIEYENVNWIRYTTDGTDPLLSGKFYSQPVVLDKTGEVKLKIAASPRWASDEMLKKEITFTVTPETTPLITNVDSAVYYQDQTLSLALGTSKKFYFTTDGSVVTATSGISTGTILLPGNAGALKDIDLRIKASLTNDVLSAEYRFFFRIDQRSVLNPAFAVISKTDTEIKIKMISSKEAKIYYSLSDALPDQSSLKFEDSISIKTTQVLENDTLLIKAIAYDLNNNKSDVMFYPVIMNSPLSLANSTMASAKIDSGKTDILIPVRQEVVYEITSDGSTPVDPEILSVQTSNDIMINLPPGMEKTFKIKIGFLKGGKVTSINSYEYIIDRKPPPNPVIPDLPVSEISRMAVSFSFKENSGKIFYQITDDGSEPQIQATTSPRYVFPVQLKGKQDSETLYRITAIAVDDLGNTSTMITESRVMIDLKKPLVPDEPYITPYGTYVEQKYKVYWDMDDASRIYYALKDSANAIPGYMAYSEPILLDFTQRDLNLFLDCYTEDKAGNRSTNVIFKINPQELGTMAPLILGAENNGYYNKRIVLKFLSSQDSIRYEFTQDGTVPPPVKISSPLINQQLIFDAKEGEVISFALRIKAFNLKVRDITGADAVIRFTIDKKLPDSPRLVDIFDGGYYYDQKQIRFEPSEDVIYYSIMTKSSGNASLSFPDFKVYKEPFLADVENGGVDSFKVLAFTMDKASNISKNVPSWEFSINKSAVYVSFNGNDYFPGTRENPFKTLTRALDYAKTTNRKLVLVSSGTYPQAKTLVLYESIQIDGGYNPITWEKDEASSKSVIVSDTQLTSGSPLVDITGGEIILSRIGLKYTNKKSSLLIRQDGGILTIKDSDLTLHDGAELIGIQLDDGALKINSSNFRTVNTASGVFIKANGGVLEMKHVSMEGPVDCEKFTCVQLLETKTSFDNCIMSPGSGKLTTGISVDDSSIILNNCRIESGVSTKNGIAINQKSGLLKMTQSILNCSPMGRYSVGILSNSVDIQLEETILNVGAKNGATGIKSTGGQLVLNRCQLKSSITSEFLYLISTYRITGRFFNNIIRGSSSGDSVCAILDESESIWANNTIIGGTGTNVTSCFIVKGLYFIDLFNNIIIREGFDSGIALNFIGNTDINTRIANNNFAGWSQIVKMDYISGNNNKAPQIYSIDKSSINSVEKLNGLDGDPLGGKINFNINESYYRIFQVSKQDDFHLSRFSACVDRGYDVSLLGFAELKTDIEANPRPIKGTDVKALYDIGAYEYNPEK